MKYKLIATDLDGTLLNNRTEVSMANKEAIARAINAGLMVVICSGRSPKSIANFAGPAGLSVKGCFGVGFNGGIVYEADTLKSLEEFVMDRETVIKALSVMKTVGPDIPYMVYEKVELIKYESLHPDILRYTGRSRIEAVKVRDFAQELGDKAYKIIIRMDPEPLYAFRERLGDKLEGICSVFFSDVNLLEVSPLNINKSTGMQSLCNRLGITMAETVCIGDNYNDWEMIRDAGLGVAVANAVEDAKAAADYITKASNDEDAVKEVIELVLSGR